MKKTRLQKPWQASDSSTMADLKMAIPQQFLILCKLMNVQPRQLIIDFMDNLACASWKREGRDEAKRMLIDYFVESKYGRDYFSEEEIRRVFKELDAIGLLYPVNAPQELINEHTRWRELYHTWWFKKWFEKENRVISPG